MFGRVSLELDYMTLTRLSLNGLSAAISALVRIMLRKMVQSSSVHLYSTIPITL